ncbi:MAG: histidinol phosphate phosphatase [Cyanobacteria bacterium PR.3.49]|nr:histidinol phosphate phosphatase [Cyanobacteria bacterium PR.3.49]
MRDPLTYLPQNVGSKELRFALEVCHRAGNVVMGFFDQDIEVEEKSDGTPVTQADKKSERLIRESIADQYPHDAILGEEEGGDDSPLSKGRRWIIDPIDGTYNYARAIPIFSTLLALENDGEIVLGVVCNPALDEIFWAERGCGAFRNGKKIKVSEIAELKNSQFNFGAPNRVQKHGLWDQFSRLVKETLRQRGFGDYLGFAHVFEGKAEAHLEVGLKPWDLAPMKIIVEEAGGAYSDLDGGKSIYTGSCLISNGLVHEQFLSILKR